LEAQFPPPATNGGRPKIRYVPVVGPRLRKLLFIVFALFAVLAVDSAYLGTITWFEWLSGKTLQNYFYQIMYLVHLALGLLIIAPVVVFGALHLRNAWKRPNRRAVRAGIALFSTALVLLVSGIVLTRLGVFEVKDPTVRSVSYWLHVIAPFAVAWLFVLHRLAGKRINWKLGARWAAFAATFAVVMLIVQAQDPRRWNEKGPASGESYYFPSLARTATGNFIPARTLMMDAYCQECHKDIYQKWDHSAHRFSSFSNPAYLFSVRETRRVSQERDGNVNRSRWCAGCHDPVPFFSGAFEDKRFDDPDYDIGHDSLAGAGITCTTCHAITNVNSPRGNADFTLEEPLHYPFAFSDNPLLKWVNRQLIKGKPAFHKKTFLKDLHRTPEFCSTCHKVHLPPELNSYKWVRGQNHYDTYHLSGVSGHGTLAYYYPPKATHKCSACHMPLTPSDDFGARRFDDSDTLKVHNHQFPAANTALPALLKYPGWVNEEHRKFLDGVVRIDLFGIKEGGTIDGKLSAPLRPVIPALEPGKRYLLETVIRTVKMGHPLTQGTVDSNELWLDVVVTSGNRVIGRSGGMNDDGAVDPWSHFVNVYMLDRNGNRIDRRNPQDIFTPLYNNQIPPGAADTVHFAFAVPRDVKAPITVDARLQYRKFDATYVKYFQRDPNAKDTLPVVTLASDRITFPVPGADAQVAASESKIDLWQRWNDYGIGLFRKGGRGELRQAESAFAAVEKLGRGDGALNLARVALREGRLDDAAAALERAAKAKTPAYPWSIAWFTGLVDRQNGRLDDAIRNFREVIGTNFVEARKREFDFSGDYTAIDDLAQTLFERAKLERGPERRGQRDALLNEAASWFEKTLTIDPEDLAAHYNLALIASLLGDEARAEQHRTLYARYKPDDNARDTTVALHRSRNPAANHAAEAVVIYDLQREERYTGDVTPILEPFVQVAGDPLDERAKLDAPAR
jgi:tetratricopeptide (TPR) repeat protein